MTAIQKKIATDYWVQKLKNKTAVSAFWESDFCEEKRTISSQEASYFDKLTGQEPMAELTVLLAIYSALTQRYFPGFERQIGYKKPSENPLIFLEPSAPVCSTFKAYLQEVKKEVQTVFTHKSYTIESVTNKIEGREISRLYNFGISIGQDTKSNVYTPLQLNFSRSTEQQIEIKIWYNTSFVSNEVVTHFLKNFRNWLITLQELIKTPIKEVNLLSESEYHQIIKDFNDTTTAYPQDSTIPTIFENQALIFPDHIAVAFGETRLIYKSLNEKSNQLGHYLRAKYQIKADDIVGVKLDKTSELLVVILGILKSGAAYLPIDKNYPEERIAYLENNSDCKLIIDAQILRDFNEVLSKYPVTNLPKINHPDSLAYVMYTSGTTGNPKGVMVTHRNVLRLVKPCNFFPLNASKTLLSTGSISFDATTIEFFGTLLNGATLVLVEQDSLLVTDRLKHTIQYHHVNSLWMTSSWFNTVVDDDISVFEDIEQLIVGGDIVSPIHVSKVYETYPDIKIVNGYGPTENTTFSTAFHIDKKEYKTIPIGIPIANSSAYILDDQLRPVPVGVEGKLYVAGAGVARGYLNRPELTATKFIKNPFKENERMYDTGDIAFWESNGVIQFTGRKDFQVKIRGYRIELEEIERCAIQYASTVKQAVVLVKEVNKEKTLVLFYVSSEAIDGADYRAFLNTKLPDYMVPSFYVQQTSIPLTAHGKVDRKKLLALNTFQGTREEYVAPENATEEKLVAIWQEVLDIEQIGVTDNFFDLGGHSLMVAQMINRIHKSLNKHIYFKEFFASPTIRQLRHKLVENTYVSIPKAIESDKYPITASQNRLWVLSQLEGGSLAYNITKAVQLHGDIDIPKFQEALRKIITRHEVLRTSFEIDEQGEVYQYVVPKGNVNFTIDVSDIQSERDKAVALENYIQQSTRIPFDLSQAPLIRASMIRLEEKKSVFLIELHHIIGDGWSVEILVSEIIKTYNALVQGKVTQFPVLPIQYKDYAVWTHSALYKNTQKESEAYWLQQLEGEIPVLEIPSSKPRPLIQTYNGAEIIHTFSASFLDQIKKFAKDNDATLFMVLMAGINSLLYRYTNQNDIIIGTPVAGRSHPELEKQIGLYLNTLAIRTKVEENQSFQSFLEHQKQVLVKAYEHQEYPLDKLINRLPIRRDTSRSALFDVMVVLQSQKQLRGIHNQETFEGLELQDHPLDRNTAQFDLSFTFVENEALELTLNYNTDIYEACFIKTICRHLENIVQQAIADPTTTIETLDMLDSFEKAQIFDEFKGVTIDYPNQHKTLEDLFEEQARKTPEDIALVYQEKELSYRQIDTMSNELAVYLQEKYTIQADDLVGVKLTRTENIVIAILGILKSGAAYVPIDSNYPQDRIAYIEKDSNCTLVLDEQELHQFSAVRHQYTDKTRKKVNTANHLAYVIYTSGTTGNPKGVMVTHSNAVELVNWSISEFDSAKFDIMYAVTSHCFDLSVFEMFYPLSIGKKLRILNNALEVPEYIQHDNNILLNTVPSVIQKMVEEDLDFSTISYINMAGEVIPVHIVQQLDLNNIEVRNLYGPSEDTTYSTGYLISDKQYDTIPIGKPLPNTSVYILDTRLQPVPIGVTGSIYISGRGVTRGYLNKPELTQTKFIENPFVSGDTMYATGDMARWLPDGNIEFLGRKDDQVKIRGYRIELGEIENAIIGFNEALKQVLVTCKEVHQEKTLVAYFVATTEVSTSQIRRYLREKLPEYMIPSFFVPLEKFPLTPNGKINKKALPAVSADQITLVKYTAPGTQQEKAVAKIWQEILGVEGIGIHDNFFELGGHSLKAVRLMNQINKELDIQLAIKDIFRLPTIAELLSGAYGQQEFSAIQKIEPQESYSLTPAQQRMWIISQFKDGNRAYTIPNIIEFNGNLDISVLEVAIRQLISRHESLRTFFKVSDQGEIRQHILPKEKVICNIKKHFIAEDNEQEVISNYINKGLAHVFDLTCAPLLHTEVLQRSNQKHIVLLTMHHIIGDGWSMEVLLQEIKSIYNALIQNTPVALQELPIQYKDYTGWLKSEDVKLRLQQSEKFWKDTFAGNIPVLELPTDLKRPKVKTYNGQSIRYTFSNTFTKALKQFVKNSEATLFMGLMAGLKGLFHRYTGQTDIVLGTPVSGRSHSDLEQQIGLFINTLAIRTSFDQDIAFKALLDQEKSNLLSAYEHQLYPFDTLVEQLNIKRDISRSALFDVMVVLHNQQQILKDDTKFIGVETQPYPYENRGSSHFDLSFLFEENSSGISVTVEFNSDIYQKSFAERLTQHFENFVIRGVQQYDQPISKLQYLTEEEQQRLLYKFNDTMLPVVGHKEDTLIDVLEAQVNKTPNEIAIQYEDKIITYQQLQDQSNQLANCLINEHKIQKGDFVGVKLSRNEWMVTAILAILKAGATYVPIDKNYPEDRIAYIESDSQCQLTLTDMHIQEFTPEAWSVSAPDVSITLNDLAYIIYTSGSTGKPKGVQIDHKNVMSLLRWSIEEFKNTPFDILYAATSYCFDLSVFEMFYPLCCGKKIRILENGLAIASQLADDNNVLINTVPSVVEELYERDILWDHVAAINMAGEPIPVGLSNHLVDFSIELRNLYGPSEDTTYSSCYHINKKHEQALPIGTPIPNTQFYILSDQMELQPEGVIGELCISGDGVSQGYLNKEALTKERFVENPFDKEKVLYKTGDLATWMPDGTVHFFGRKDDQVKIRGYRIELGEIQNALVLEENITQAVVLVKQQKGNKLLVAYILGEDIKTKSLQENLKKSLPGYMIPDAFVMLDTLPLTPNGKTDKKALLQYDIFDKPLQNYQAPQSDIEKELAHIWQEILGFEKLGVKDNFFELGGNSLKAMKLIFAIENKFDVPIDVQEVFENPTIEFLAITIENFKWSSQKNDNLKKIVI